MTDHMINVGLAGFGLSGKIFQAPFLHANEHFEIKKVFERSSEKSREEYPYVDVVHNFEELLSDDIDLVVISTPNAHHVPMATKAIQAGKHVVVEKPIAATSEEALELCSLAKKNNVLFSVYQNRRLDGDFVTLKKIIEENRLGEVVDYEAHFDRFVTGASSKKWKYDNPVGADVLYDLGVHIIDQAYYLFGMPKEVYADFRKQREESAGIDNFEVILYYEGKKAILSASEVAAKQGPHYMVHGRKGTFIKFGMDLQESNLCEGKRPPSDDWGLDRKENYGTLSFEKDGTIMDEIIVTERGDYGLFYENLFQALIHGKDLLVKPEEAADVLKILEAAIKSDSEKRRIAL